MATNKRSQLDPMKTTARNRRYYVKNRAKILVKNKAWRQNPAKRLLINAAVLRYYHKHKEKLKPIRRAQWHRWYGQHREEFCAQGRERYRLMSPERRERVHQYTLSYYQKNKEHLIQKGIEWRRTHKDQINAYVKRWHAAHRDYWNKYQRIRWKFKYAAQKVAKEAALEKIAVELYEKKQAVNAWYKENKAVLKGMNIPDIIQIRGLKRTDAPWEEFVENRR